MSRRFFSCSLALVTICLSLMLSAGYVFAQWPPAQSQYPPQQPGYPTQQPGYPSQQPGYPSQQPGYPPQQPGYPSQQPGYPQQQPQQYAPQMTGGQTFSDAFGRFKVNLPQGTMPMGATYNFGVPSAMCQVSIMVVGMDQMFQMQMQNFPNMLKQMGANIESESQMEVGGRPARVINAAMRDQTSGSSMRMINVFIQGANLLVQVMGPDQNSQQIQQVLQAILGGLQF